MKNFVLDSTYRDSIIVNSNDEFAITPANILSNNPATKYEINSTQLSNNNILHQTKNDNFNRFNFIDYI